MICGRVIFSITAKGGGRRGGKDTQPCKVVDDSICDLILIVLENVLCKLVDFCVSLFQFIFILKKFFNMN